MRENGCINVSTYEGKWLYKCFNLSGKVAVLMFQLMRENGCINVSTYEGKWLYKCFNL